jgi:hypothetical protein
MLFINWFLFRMVVVFVAAIVGCAAAIWATRRRKLLIRIPVLVVSVPIGVIGALLISLVVLGQLMGCDTHSRPLYSPDGKSAVRIETFDGGGTGGDTSVVFYTMHGFRTSKVFNGGWRSVEDGDIQWVNDSNLLIRYGHYWDGYDESCQSTQNIRVQCVRKN